jgi:hypothetical protein
MIKAELPSNNELGEDYFKINHLNSTTIPTSPKLS